MATLDPLDDILELSRLLRPAWDEISSSIPDWHPRCEGDPDPDPDSDPEPDADPDPAAEGDPPEGDPDKIDWKREARKHERRAKQAAKEKDELAARIAEIENSNQSESEKAIAKAREEAKAEAEAAGREERRNDRLEVAVTRLAAKSFADTEDALLNVHKAIRDGDIDPDDIFTDEGKVQTDALTTALDELLERKPHLKASGNGRPAGDADAGKGSPGKGPDDMSVEEHFQAVKRS